ncbi:MAG: hypothetical protein HYV42_04105 [Candidatus Magasanikbacteria bacterium]|nr:hypothetical protein [Candidatus Magasanikbacteria bacterium]
MRLKIQVEKRLNVHAAAGWGHSPPPASAVQEEIIVEVTPDAAGVAEINLGNHRVTLRIAIVN